MKIRILYFILFIWGCKNADIKNIYDEANYVLIKIDTVDNRIIAAKHYVNKYDTSRKMLIDYWDNGKILGKTYFYGKHLDGKLEMYNSDGRLTSIDLYHNGVLLSTELFDTLGHLIKK